MRMDGKARAESSSVVAWLMQMAVTFDMSIHISIAISAKVFAASGE